MRSLITTLALIGAGLVVGTPQANAADAVYNLPAPDTTDTVVVDGAERIVLPRTEVPAGTSLVSLADWPLGFDPETFAVVTAETKDQPRSKQEFRTHLGLASYLHSTEAVNAIQYTNFTDIVGEEANCSGASLDGEGAVVDTLAGDDTVICVVGSIDVGEGNDTVYGFNNADAQPINLGEGDDTAFVDENLHAFVAGRAGTFHADTSADHDNVSAGAGDDTVYASTNDTVTDAEHVLRPAAAAPAPVAKPGQPKHVITKRVTRSRAWVQWACAPRATSYRVRVGAARTFVTTGMRINVGRLHRGRAYAVRVVGVNASGAGLASRVAWIGARVR